MKYPRRQMKYPRRQMKYPFPNGRQCDQQPRPTLWPSPARSNQQQRATFKPAPALGAGWNCRHGASNPALGLMMTMQLAPLPDGKKENVLIIWASIVLVLMLGTFIGGLIVGHTLL